MSDLSAFDWQHTFTAKEAAALIGGVDPRARDQNDEIVGFSIVEPIYRRIIKDWGEAISMWDVEWIDPEMLRSVSLEAIARLHSTGETQQSSKCPVETRDEAIFSRQEIARWLISIGMKSVYPFAPIPPSPEANVAPTQSPAGHWPWGNHHTKNLGHLEAAAQRYWVRYDPADATTAPINDDLINWLMTSRKVSNNMARAIATMLRADDLPHGPRT